MKRQLLKISLISLAFGLFSATAHAQRDEDIFQMAGSYEMLSNILDPYYKPDGTIDYYGLGHFLRLRKQPDKNGKPEKEIVELWDKDDLEWKTYQEKRYFYTKDGKLEEEQVWQCAPLSHQITYPRIMKSQKHHYNQMNHTDSVIFTVYPETTIGKILVGAEVNYLNSQEQPDSIYAYFTDNDQQYLVEKRYMNYELGKLTKITTESDQTYDLLEANRYYTYLDYTPAKNTYLYEANDKKQTSAKQQVWMDTHGRITQVITSVEEGNTFEAKYSYDSRQRTIVHKVVRLLTRFFKIEGYSDFSVLEYDMKYTDKDEKQITYYLRAKDNVLKTKLIVRQAYTPSGKLAYTELEGYSRTGAMMGAKKTVRMYDINDQLICQSEYVRTDLNSDYTLSDKSTYEYNKHGYRTLDQQESMADDGKTSLSKSKTLRTFDVDGRMLSEHKYKWEKNQWLNTHKKQWKYSPTGKEVFLQEYQWQPYNNGHWEGVDYHTTTYDKNDSIAGTVNYRHEVINFFDNSHRPQWRYEWKPLYAEDFSYFPHAKETTRYKWKEGIKTPQSRILKYAVPDSVSTILSGWNNDKSQWEVEERHDEYTHNDVKVSETYDKHNKYRIFAGSEKKETKKQKTDKGDSYYQTIYTWDFDKKNWIPSERRSMLLSESDDPQVIYEVYDPKTGEWSQVESNTDD